jgi:hypothetical protein
VVGWNEITGRAYVAYRPRRGSFDRAQLLRGHPLRDLAITPRGEAVAALGDAELAADGAKVAVRPAGPGKRFGRPVDVSDGQKDVTGLVLDSGPAGEVVAVWQAGSRVWAAIRAANGGWSAPAALSEVQSGGGPIYPRVAVLPSGAALAVWERRSGSPTCCQRLEAAVRPAGGAFGAPVTLTPAGGSLKDLKGAGNRWGILVQAEDDLELFERPEVGAFTGPQAIPGATVEYGEAALALAPDGSASVLKSAALPASAACSGTTYHDANGLATTSRPAGGSFGPDHLVTPVTQPGAGPSAAVAGGRSVFTWDQPRRTELSGVGDYSDELVCDFIGAQPYGADGAPGSDPGPSSAAGGSGVDSGSATSFHTYPVLATDPDGTAAVAWIHTDDRGRNQRVRVALIGGGSLGRNRYPDIVSPRVVGLRLSSARVQPGEPVALRFRLSERARVVMTITRWWGHHTSGQFHTRRVSTIRFKHARGQVTIRFHAPSRGRYTLHLEARDRGGNPSYGGPFNFKFRVR